MRFSGRIQPVQRKFVTREERMKNYKSIVRDLAEQFDKFELTRILQGEDMAADALVALASTLGPNMKRVIYVEAIDPTYL